MRDNADKHFLFLDKLPSIAMGAYQDCYRPQRSWGKVMFSQACVILFTRGCLPQCMLGYHPPPGADTPQSRPPTEQTPPRSRHPQEQTLPSPLEQTPPSPEQTPPGADTPLRADTPLQSRYPPPEQTPPRSRYPPPPRGPDTPLAEHAGRYGQRAGGMHPTGMQSCFFIFQ